MTETVEQSPSERRLLWSVITVLGVAAVGLYASGISIALRLAAL
jgi:hypothetical protein